MVSWRKASWTPRYSKYAKMVSILWCLSVRVGPGQGRIEFTLYWATVIVIGGGGGRRSVWVAMAAGGWGESRGGSGEWERLGVVVGRSGVGG